jgi:SAM-dependent methyltransferase
VKREFYAEYYEMEDRHWWFVGRRRIFLALLDRHLGSNASGRRVLDVGCGTGTMLGYLSRYGKAEGVDADPEAVQFCHQRGVERVRLVESGPLPHDPETFDLVTALDVIEHVDDDAGMVREMERVLRRGGTLLVSVPAYRWMWGSQDEIAHHKRRYLARELRGKIAGAGLDVRRLSYFNTLLFPPIAAVRVLRPYRPGSADLRSDFELTRPGRMNDLLARVFSLEARVLPRLGFPFGVSILALAIKAGQRPGRTPK